MSGAVYRSAAGSTVTLIGRQPTNWTIDFRATAERMPPTWRSVRFLPDPPRLRVWFRDDAAPTVDIALEEAHIAAPERPESI